MPTKKIKGITQQDFCTHPEHKPPQFRVFEPGEYEHTCPACGKVTKFTVPLIRF